MTNRQLQAWTEYDDRQWNQPSRSDYYIMSLIDTLVQLNSKKRKRKKLDDYRIPFKIRRKPLTEAEKKQLIKQHIAMRIGQLGGNVRVVRPGEPYPK